MNTLQLKISLAKAKPPLWRRILVPGHITFEGLHYIIQALFGFDDDHLYEFDVNGFEFGNADSENDPSDACIYDYLLEAQTCKYTYDFGDDWNFKIIVEEVLEDESNAPVAIVKHKGGNLEEDSGGVYAYNAKAFDIPFDLAFAQTQMERICQTYVLKEISYTLHIVCEQDQKIWRKITYSGKHTFEQLCTLMEDVFDLGYTYDDIFILSDQTVDNDSAEYYEPIYKLLPKKGMFRFIYSSNFEYTFSILIDAATENDLETKVLEASGTMLSSTAETFKEFQKELRLHPELFSTSLEELNEIIEDMDFDEVMNDIDIDYEETMIGSICTDFHQLIHSFVKDDDCILRITKENGNKSTYIWMHKDSILHVYIIKDEESLNRTIRSFPDVSLLDVSYIKGFLIEYSDDQDEHIVSLFHTDGKDLRRIDDSVPELKNEIIDLLCELCDSMEDLPSMQQYPDVKQREYLHYHIATHGCNVELASLPECSPFQLSIPEKMLYTLEDLKSQPRSNEKLIIYFDHLLSFEAIPIGTLVSYLYIAGKKYQTYKRIDDMDNKDCGVAILTSIIEIIKEHGRPKRICFCDESLAVTLKPYLEPLQIHVVSDIPMPKKKYAQLKQAALEHENPMTESDRLWFIENFTEPEDILEMINSDMLIDPRLFKMKYTLEIMELCRQFSKLKD